MNFEFSLENGKKQLKWGLIFLGANIIAAALMWILLACIKNEVALIVIAVIFGLGVAALAIFALVKLIFGIVVYHAERTASRPQ